MEEFFVLSLKWSDGMMATWWKPNDSGYTYSLEEAGRYSREAVEDKANYYNDGETTLAIPVEKALAMSFSAVLNDSYKFRGIAHVSTSGKPV